MRVLSLPGGVYSCCQIVGWADEQWQVWLEAAKEDGKQVDEVTRTLERVETEAVLVSDGTRHPLIWVSEGGTRRILDEGGSD